MAVKPGIEEFTFSLDSESYKFPCSLISDGKGELIRDLQLHFCVFCPTVGLGCLRSLTSLDMYKVCITGNDLEHIMHILSNSFALERLLLRYCSGLLYVKMPCRLERLSYLKVLSCSKLQVIESRAPNLSSFIFQGSHRAQLSLGESSQVKYLNISLLGAVHNTRAEVAASMPYLETVFIYSSMEVWSEIPCYYKLVMCIVIYHRSNTWNNINLTFLCRRSTHQLNLANFFTSSIWVSLLQKWTLLRAMIIFL
jgi:hypothetical protein